MDPFAVTFPTGSLVCAAGDFLICRSSANGWRVYRVDDILLIRRLIPALSDPAMLMLEEHMLDSTPPAHFNEVQLVLSIVGAGNIVGEMGVFDGEPRSATCKAFTDMEVAVLDKDALAKLISQEPAVGCKLLAAILQRTSGRLRATNKKLRLLSQVARSLEREVEILTKSAVVAPATPFVGNPLMS